jgi:hypothetical protein
VTVPRRVRWVVPMLVALGLVGCASSISPAAKERPRIDFAQYARYGRCLAAQSRDSASRGTGGVDAKPPATARHCDALKPQLPNFP